MLFGWPGRDRTDDLFHAIAISHLGLERNDTGKLRVTPRGQCPCGPTHLPCPSRVPERQGLTRLDPGRDTRVTTQTATQKPHDCLRARGPSCPAGRGRATRASLGLPAVIFFIVILASLNRSSRARFRVKHPEAAPASHRFGLTRYGRPQHRGSVRAPSWNPLRLRLAAP